MHYIENQNSSNRLPQTHLLSKEGSEERNDLFSSKYPHLIRYDVVATLAAGDITITYDGLAGLKIDAKNGGNIVPGKVGGLCGNFNGRVVDDYTSNSWPPG